MNRNTGKIEWSIDAPGMKPVFCTPTVAGGRVYCGEGEHKDKGCRIFCVNTTDGNSKHGKNRSEPTSHTEASALAVAGGKVYFPAYDDGLYCCDAVTGAKIEQFPGGKEKGIHIDAAPAVANGIVYVGSGLYTYVAVALDANTMAEKWRTDLKLRAFGAPTVSGSKVFYAVGTGNMGADTWHYDEEVGVNEKEAAGAVVCLDATTGKEEWRYPLPKSVHTGVAADAFSVYVGCRDGSVYAIDRKSGKLRWKTGIGGAVLSCPRGRGQRRVSDRGVRGVAGGADGVFEPANRCRDLAKTHARLPVGRHPGRRRDVFASGAHHSDCNWQHANNLRRRDDRGPAEPHPEDGRGVQVRGPDRGVMTQIRPASSARAATLRGEMLTRFAGGWERRRSPHPAGDWGQRSSLNASCSRAGGYAPLLRADGRGNTPFPYCSSFATRHVEHGVAIRQEGRVVYSLRPGSSGRGCPAHSSATPPPPLAGGEGGGGGGGGRGGAGGGARGGLRSVDLRPQPPAG